MTKFNKKLQMFVKPKKGLFSRGQGAVFSCVNVETKVKGYLLVRKQFCLLSMFEKDKGREVSSGQKTVLFCVNVLKGSRRSGTIWSGKEVFVFVDVWV